MKLILLTSYVVGVILVFTGFLVQYYKANQYENLFYMCEAKYQLGIDGKIDEANQMKGRMEVILDRIEGR